MKGQWLHNLKAVFKSSAIVLMYHRVAAPETDPWQLAVTPENFEQQLRLLIKNYSVVSIPQLIEMVREKRLNKRTVALTFDDGYIDNYHIVKPLLEKYSVPATFFITTDYIGQEREYWWDELEKIILQSRALPAHLSLEIKGTPILFDLDTETILTAKLKLAHKKWTYYMPPTLRGELYLKLWQHISPLACHEQEQVMEQLRVWADVNEIARPDYFCMTLKQLSELSSGGLINLGAHTASHPALACHQKKIQQREIVNSTAYLEKLTGNKINAFAYPSGSYNNDTVDVLMHEQYDVAFTTYPKPITKDDHDLYRLGRFQVNNWDKVAFEKTLHNWSLL
jgi:peptidoglycan/xylan/chitin deacetylase (PgdA/CDA1 family)